MYDNTPNEIKFDPMAGLCLINVCDFIIRSGLRRIKVYSECELNKDP